METRNQNTAAMPQTGGESGRANTSFASDGDDFRIVTVCSVKDEREVNGEVTLPDYFANAEKIFFTTAIPSINEKYIEDGKITYSGKVTFMVFFITSENELKSISFEGGLDGEKTLCLQEKNDGDTNYTASIFPVCRPASCRLIGPRRMSAKCRTTSDICVTSESIFEPRVSGEFATQGDAITLQRKSDTVETLHEITFCEDDLRFSDDIEIESSLPPVAEIICCNVNVIPEESKLSGDTIQLRGTVIVNCLCVSENGELMSVQKKLPLSESFDAPEDAVACDDTNCFANITITSVSAEISDNSFGEKRIVELDFTYSAELFCMCGRQTTLTRDIYSTEYKTESEYKTVSLCTLSRVLTSNFSVNASSQFESTAATDAISKITTDTGSENEEVRALPEQSRIPRAPSVLFTAASIKDISSAFDEQKSRISVSGTSEIYMIVNDDGNIRGLCFQAPFKNDIDGYGMTGKIISAVSAACQPVHGRSDTSSVYADFEVNLTVTVFSNSDEEIIEKVNLDKSSLFDPMSRPPILIYYPHRGESLWNIAKKYSTTVSALREVNHLQGDVSPDDSVMIIPRHIKPAGKAKLS